MKPCTPAAPLGDNRYTGPSSLLPGQTTKTSPYAPDDPVRDFVQQFGYSDQERKISDEAAVPPAFGQRNRAADPVARVPAGLSHRRSR